jgi:hypothetical protein
MLSRSQVLNIVDPGDSTSPMRPMLNLATRFIKNAVASFVFNHPTTESSGVSLLSFGAPQLSHNLSLNK